MNKNLLILPLSIIAFLLIFLLPVVPQANTLTCPCGGIPGDAKLLPSGQYIYETFDSPLYWLSNFGGVINASGQYLIVASNLTSFGVILFLIFPLCVFASAGFVLALATGKKKVPWQERARACSRESSGA